MEEIPEVKIKRKKWIYFLRQLMVSSGVWTTFFMVGQFLGAPTVFIPQLRKDPTMSLNDEMASWLYSVIGIATLPWVFILPVVTRLYGLRIGYIVVCVDLLLAYLIFYFSTSPVQILISEIIFGVSKAGTLTVGLIIVSEYTSPEYRGMFLTIKAASVMWGVWSANAIGTFFHWKNIAYSGFLCSVFTFNIIFWPESPQWLASKGRFDECSKAYYWLQGHDEKSEKEVEELIASQAIARNIIRKNNDWSNLSNAVKIIRSREFYAPLILTVLLVSNFFFSGKVVCSMYAIDILKKMSGSESTAYMGMLIIDGVTLFSMYFGCFLTKILKRRTLYFISSVIGISFLFQISLYLYLVKLTVIEESKLLSVILLICHSVAMGFGPMIMNTSIYAEIVPLRFKSIIISIAAVLFFVYSTVLLKMAPYLFNKLGLDVFFLLYGLAAGVCTAILYKYLPETKDKTLQEIELNFQTRNKSDCEMKVLKNGDNED